MPLSKTFTAIPTSIAEWNRYIRSLNVTPDEGTVTEETIVDGSVTPEKLSEAYYTETELDAGQLNSLYYTETELDAGQLDNRYYTETEVDDLLSALKWDDLRAPATAINPPGAASDPDRDTSDGTLVFDSSKTELVFIAIQMPHAWADGTDIHPHVHWAKTTSAAGNVAWELEYKIAPIGIVRDAAWTSLGVKSVSAITDNNTAEEHLITDLGNMSMTGRGDSDMIFFKFSRIGGDALDTYGADAKLFEFDVHYQSDDRGSTIEYPI